MRRIWMLCALVLSLTVSVSTAEAVTHSARSHGPRWTQAVKHRHKAKRATHHSTRSKTDRRARPDRFGCRQLVASAAGSDPVLLGDQNVETGLDSNSRRLGRGLPVHRHHDRVRPVDHGVRGFAQPRRDLDRGPLQRPQWSPGRAVGVGNQDVARKRGLEYRFDRVDGRHVRDEVLGDAARKGWRTLLPRPLQRHLSQRELRPDLAQRAALGLEDRPDLEDLPGVGVRGWRRVRQPGAHSPAARRPSPTCWRHRTRPRPWSAATPLRARPSPPRTDRGRTFRPVTPTRGRTATPQATAAPRSAAQLHRATR